MKKLRYYQEEAHKAFLESIERGVHAQLFHMATGTGKTFTTTSLIQSQPERFQKVLWLTHKEELIDQSAFALIYSMLGDDFTEDIDKIKKHFNGSFVSMMKDISQGTMFSNNVSFYETLKWIQKNMGLIKRDINQFEKNIVVASIQTITRRLQHLDKHHYDLVVIDEAHLALSKSWMRVCRTVPHDYRLGLSATPERMDGVAMDQLFDEITYVYDIRKGIEDKYLSQINAIRVKTEINLDNVKTTAGELNQKDLRIVDCPARNNHVATKWVEYGKGRKTLVFAVNITHAVNLTQVFKNRGVKAEVVVSDENICPDRRQTIKNFVEGDTEVLVNVDILTTGFDYPNIGCIVMARPTKSRNLYIQIVGRGTRLKSEEFTSKYGQEMLLLDVVDVSSRHSLINAYTLDYGKRIEDRIFLTDEQRQDYIEKRDAKADEKLSKIDRITLADVKVNLLQLPEIDTRNISRMEREEMTDKQRKVMVSLGYDVENNSYTKADAFMAIGNQPATAADVANLKAMGYDTELGATKYQFVQAKKEQHERYQQKRKEWKAKKKKAAKLQK